VHTSDTIMKKLYTKAAEFITDFITETPKTIKLRLLKVALSPLLALGVFLFVVLGFTVLALSYVTVFPACWVLTGRNLWNEMNH
jgi:hypothetical protein